MHRTPVLRSLTTLFLLMWVITGCELNWSGTEVSPTATPLPLGPAVISNNPDVVVEAWEYISPQSEEAVEQFPLQDPRTIQFNPETEAYILWDEDGFDIYWVGYICSTQPVVIIDEMSVELWPYDTFWENCDSMAVGHAFRVDVETTIPWERWSYEIHSGAPPVDPLPIEERR